MFLSNYVDILFSKNQIQQTLSAQYQYNIAILNCSLLRRPRNRMKKYIYCNKIKQDDKLAIKLN